MLSIDSLESVGISIAVWVFPNQYENPNHKIISTKNLILYEMRYNFNKNDFAMIWEIIAYHINKNMNKFLMKSIILVNNDLTILI